MSFLGFSELYIGTEVTFTAPSPQKWVTEEKLTEDVQQMTKWELDGGAGPPFAVFKYLCYSVTDSDKKAFMRIYFQNPIAGTEYQPLEVRQRQAAPPRKHRELDALKDLQLRQCPVVPTLLAYKEDKQGNNGVVPDGYITHIVWDKVPGKSLNQDEVWDSKSGLLREAVRAKFRDIWEYIKPPFYQSRVKLTDLRELRRYGWEPGMPGLENIIYDEVTKVMYVVPSIHLVLNRIG